MSVYAVLGLSVLAPITLDTAEFYLFLQFQWKKESESLPSTCTKTTNIVATENLLCLLGTFIDFKIQTHQENGDGPQGYAEILREDK